MSTLMYWIIGVTLAISILLLVVILIVRFAKPHSKKMDALKSHGQNGDHETRPKESPAKKSNWEEFKSSIPFGWKSLWNILAFLSVAWIFHWSSQHPELDGATIGELGHTYWIQILIIGAGISFLIWLNVEGKTAKQLHNMVLSVLVVLLIGFPVWSWISSSGIGWKSISASGTQSTGCVVAYSPEKAKEYTAFSSDGGYTSRSHWMSFEIPPGGTSCHVETPPTGSVVWDADSPSIHTLEVQCVFKNGSTGSVRTDDCTKPGVTVIEGMVRNTTESPVRVYAAYTSSTKGGI